MDWTFAYSLLLQMIAYTSGYLYPSFDMRVGQTLDTSTSYFFKTLPSLCNCRQLCYENEQCIAFRTAPTSYRWSCFLFKFGLSYQLLNETNQSVQLGIKIVPGSQMEADGLYYYIYPTKLNYTRAKEACQTGPNYRLVLPKTLASFNIAVAYSKKVSNKNVLIDLMKWNTTDQVFGDGTPFKQTEIGNQNIYMYGDAGINASVFTVSTTYFDDDFPSNPFNVLCQGNPLGV